MLFSVLYPLPSNDIWLTIERTFLHFSMCCSAWDKELQKSKVKSTFDNQQRRKYTSWCEKYANFTFCLAFKPHVLKPQIKQTFKYQTAFFTLFRQYVFQNILAQIVVEKLIHAYFFQSNEVGGATAIKYWLCNFYIDFIQKYKSHKR